MSAAIQYHHHRECHHQYFLSCVASQALGAANPNKDPLSRVAQWILTDGATYPQGELLTTHAQCLQSSLVQHAMQQVFRT
jgi:hypothetical protein